MAKKAWKKFPHPDKNFAYAGANLEKHWARLHRGDCEPFPDNDAARDAWRAYHAGDFAKAVHDRDEGWIKRFLNDSDNQKLRTFRGNL